MARKLDTYAATQRDRALVRDIVITFAYGQELTGVMQLSIAQVEQMRRQGDITAVAHCQECGEHIVDCPKVGHLLLDWPAGYSWRAAVQHAEGLAVLVG